MIALLGASGIRIGEAQALRIGPTKGPLGDSSCWRADNATLEIFTSVYGGQEQTPKTDSARRQIELAPEINNLLKDYAGIRSGFLLGNGGPPSESSLRCVGAWTRICRATAFTVCVAIAEPTLRR